MADRRREPRLRSYLGGKIVFKQRYAVIDCLVRNVSAQGARLEFSQSAILPDEFELRIPHRATSYRARIRWRHLDAAGTTLDPLPAAEPAPADQAGARVPEAENRTPRLRLVETVRPEP